MNCIDCKNDPSYHCSCSDISLCSNHLGQHLEKPGNHNPKRLYLMMGSFQQSNFKKDLKNKIEILKAAKNQIKAKTNELVKRIESKCREMIEDIDKLISENATLLSKSKFKCSDISLSDNEYTSSEFNIKKLLSAIKKTYTQKPIQVHFDPVKVKSLKQNRFLLSHNGGFNCLAIFNQGANLITGSEDSSVRVWDIKTSEQLECLTSHKASVDCLALNSNSSLLASGSFDKTFIVWNCKEWKISMISPQGLGAVFSLAFSLDSKLIISGCSEQQITIWNIQLKTFVARIATSNPVYCGIISSANHYFSGIGETLCIWKLQPFETINSKKLHDSDINSIALFKNEKFIVTGSDDKLVKVWTVDLNKLYACFKGHSQAITSVTSSKDDKLIISASIDETVIIWNFESKSKMHHLNHHKDHIYGITCFDDLLFSASRDSRIGVASLLSGQYKYFIQLKPFTVKSAAFKNNLVAFGSLNDVLIYNFNDNNIQNMPHSHSDIVQSTSFSENLLFLVSASAGTTNNLILWDLETMKIRSSLNGHDSSVFCADISKDEKKVISGDEKGDVLLWSTENYTLSSRFQGHSSQIYSIKFSTNIKYAASGGLDKKVLVWDLLNKNIYASFNYNKESIEKVLFTEDDQHIIAAGNFYGIHVWSLSEKIEKKEEECEILLNQHRILKSELASYLF